MSYIIAVAGKGGTGKTTFCGLMIRHLLTRGKTPVLAVDADANANLHEVLGIKVGESVGSLREKAMAEVKDLPAGVTKEQYIEQRIHEILVEASGFDLMTMGRPEGPGCYCYANHLIRKYSERIGQSYKYVIMDNEAGLEHLSRRTTQGVDALVISTDETLRGLRTVQRILDIIVELQLDIKKTYLVVNRSLNGLTDAFHEVIAGMRVQFLGAIPSDELLIQYDLEGKPLIQLPDNSLAVQKVSNMMSELVGNN
ncbi:MAG: AAA family ATPase [Deltaproteobacteria bacterium]|nr:AAA family ATPase [Deltaproteobacteria bacterium]